MAHHEFPAVQQFLPLGARKVATRGVCAQRNIDDVPVVRFVIDAENLAELYLELLQKIIRRAERISSATYYGKPITPFENPANRSGPRTTGHSYFRVCWRCIADPSRIIEFLIRDYDLYLLGFRQQIVDEEEWSIWYCFKDDLGWPAFFREGVHVQRILFDGGHQNQDDIAGAGSLSFIFYTLAYWNPNGGQETMIQALQLAVVFLSEALRFHWVEEEMLFRIQYYAADAEPQDLDITQYGVLPIWKRIGNWGNFSRIALEAGLNNGIIRTRREMGGSTGFDLVYRVYGFMDMMEGLKVLKRIEGCPELEPKRNQTRDAYGRRVVDPGFIALNEQYPEDAAGNWWIP